MRKLTPRLRTALYVFAGMSAAALFVVALSRDAASRYAAAPAPVLPVTAPVKTPLPDRPVPARPDGPVRAEVRSEPIHPPAPDAWEPALWAALGGGDGAAAARRWNALPSDTAVRWLEGEAAARLCREFPSLPTEGRRAAAWVLSRGHLPGVAAFLGAQVATERDPDVRHALVQALRELTEAEAARILRELLVRDPDAGLRSAAAYALATRAGAEPASLDALARGLAEDPSPLVRAACASALAGGPSSFAAEALLAALGSGDPGVRAAAGRSLEAMEGFVHPERLAPALAAEKDATVREVLRDVDLVLRRDPEAQRISGCDGDE